MVERSKVVKGLVTLCAGDEWCCDVDNNNCYLNIFSHVLIYVKIYEKVFDEKRYRLCLLRLRKVVRWVVPIV